MIIIGFSVCNIKDNMSEKCTNVKYLLLLLFGNFCNSVSCIFFDRKIKQKNVNYWEYMYTYTFLNLLISSTELVLEYSLSSYDFAAYLRNKEFYLNVVAQTLETFLIAYVSFQLTPLQRGLNHIVCAVSITILTNVFFETSPGIYQVLACIFTYAGLVMFELKSLKRIITRQNQERS
ncbi:putative transporter [Trachipleistophora hominis]|uniref:Putative transporter n=1 Tax=Trachipleistophora hominis TaxID=72359 RepID=L7JY67_TRAHO|nr:putative transporter [Trachipleistophora hominis]